MHLSPQRLLACLDGETHGLRGKLAARHFRGCVQCRAEAARIAAELSAVQERAAPGKFVTREELDKGLTGVLASLRERRRALPAIRQLAVYFGSRIAAGRPDADRLGRMARELSSVFLGRRAGPGAMRRIWFPEPGLILFVTITMVAVCAMLTMAGFAAGNSYLIDFAFRYPGALLLICLAGAELHLAIAVRRRFVRDDLLWSAWTLLAAAAACHLGAEAITQVISGDAVLVPALGGEQVQTLVSRVALTVGGPVRLGLLACGLGCVVYACHRTGILPRLTLWDRLAVAAVACFALVQLHDAWASGSIRFSVYSIAGLITDPLIAILLAEALIIRRAVSAMGWGLVAKCWAAFAAGAALTAAGSLGLWAGWHGYTSWPWSAAAWFVWFFASAAFAIGPAYQAKAENLAACAAQPAGPSLLPAGAEAK